MYDTFHAEISYSKVAFTLNRLSVILLVVVLSCSFVARKNQSARHKQKQSFYVLLTSRKRHSSVTQGASTLLCKAKGNGCKQHSSGKVNLPSSQPMLSHRRRKHCSPAMVPQTTSRPNIGGKRTRFSRKNSNMICIAQTTFALSPLFGRLFAVFLIVPVFFFNYH